MTPEERARKLGVPVIGPLAGNDSSRPLLNKLQDYITGNAP